MKEANDGVNKSQALCKEKDKLGFGGQTSWA